MAAYDASIKERATSSVFRDAALFGVEAAGTTVLFGKAALRLPVAISDNPGGRKSIHDMPQSEPALTGVYVVDLQVVKEVLTRTGDTSYEVELASKDGQTLFEGMGNLQHINPEIGYSSITFKGKYKELAPTLLGLEADEPAEWTRFTIVWSGIAW
ncbi:hypothetical protein [Streptomyces achromogenes]|uniref:hypothetical protein n=1 Tax=Streptomyces achromogenes TaxID=67255 RepID=UPI0036B048AC